jgi:hydroxymethylglutaryl-CoA reductase
MNHPSSRLPGFFKQPLAERVSTVAAWASLSDKETAILKGAGGLTDELADKLIENALGIYGLPFGIASNFLINNRDVLVPMVTEEPSVVAGASFAAKLARSNGGFRTSSTKPEMIGQIQVLDLQDPEAVRANILQNKAELLTIAHKADKTIDELGGGPRDILVRVFHDTPVGPMLVIHLIFDCLDAMGANMVNTACEHLATPIERMTGGRVGLRILSNLADRRMARAECTVLKEALAFEGYTGEQVVNGIVEAWAFASVDPYRAATHNKGIMNGIDSVVIATGNDWRAIEAGAHAYASRNGQYTSLSTWNKDQDGNLTGSLELPMAVGIIGGSTRVHPAARIALKILNVRSARELAEIIVAVGLAQNLAAIRALATEGIQKGHMALHARQMAVAAGAEGNEVETVVERLLSDKEITLEHAEALLRELFTKPGDSSRQAGKK